MSGARQQVFSDTDNIINDAFVKVLERFDNHVQSNSGIRYYSFENMTVENTPLPSGANKTDISPQFMKDMTYLLTAIRDIELPTSSITKYDETHRQQLEKLFDTLSSKYNWLGVSFKNTDFGKNPVYADCRPDGAAVAPLILPGLNAIIPSSLFYRQENVDMTDFEQLIIYVLYNVALRKKSVSAEDVIEVLKQNDRIIFGPLVKSVTEKIINNANVITDPSLKNLLGNKVSTKKALFAVLKNLARRMMNDLNTDSAANTSDGDILSLKTTLGAACEELKESEVIKDEADNYKAFYQKLLSLADATKLGDNANVEPEKIQFFANGKLDMSSEDLFKLTNTDNFNEPKHIKYDLLHNYSLILKDDLADFKDLTFKIKLAKDLQLNAQQGLLETGVTAAVADEAFTVESEGGGMRGGATEGDIIGPLNFFNNATADRIFIHAKKDGNALAADTNDDFIKTGDNEFKCFAAVYGTTALKKGNLTGRNFGSKRIIELLFSLAIIRSNWKKKYATIKDIPINEFKNTLSGLIDDAAEVSSRLIYVETKLSSAQSYINTLKDNFISSLLSYIMLKKSFSQPASKQPYKGNLLSMKNSYRNFIIPNNTLFEKYFNLVKTDPTTKVQTSFSNIKEAESAPDNELVNWRLNAKKNSDVRSLLMTGGADYPNEIYIIAKVPLLPSDNSIVRLYINDREFFAVADIRMNYTSDPDNALKSFCRQIFFSNPGQSNIELKVGPKKINIDVKKVALEIAKRYNIKINWKTHFNDLIRRSQNLPGQQTNIPQAQWWSNFERGNRQREFNSMTEWELDENGNYVRIGKDGNEIMFDPSDSCGFLNVAGSDCTSFLTDCAFGNDSWPTICKDIYKNPSFSINVSPSTIANEVKKIHPSFAVAILTKFGFTTVNEKSDVRGIVVKRIESVGSWLKKLDQGLLNHHFQNDEQEIRDLINSNDSRAHNFVQYFDVLVDWVNANPQSLNPEFSGKSMPGPRTPPSLQAYEIYPNYPSRLDYRIYNRARSLNNSLGRLRIKFGNTYAHDNRSTISNVIQMASMLSPLNTQAYMFSNPFSNYNHLQMLGGVDWTDVSEEILKPDGSILLYEIYKNIVKELEELNKISNKKLQLSPKTYAQLERKLEKLKDAEKELKKEYRDMYQKLKLHVASNGMIDINRINDQNVNEILNKHSAFFDLAGNFRSRAAEITDALQAITSAIMTRAPQPSGNQSQQSQPLFSVTTSASQKPVIVNDNSGPYVELSPFHDTSFTYAGAVHKSIFHALAYKFIDPVNYNAVQQSKTPLALYSDLKTAGHLTTNNPTYNSQIRGELKAIITAKAQSVPTFAAKLKSTGTAPIYYNPTVYDLADSNDLGSSGGNLYGFKLAEVRDSLP